MSSPSRAPRPLPIDPLLPRFVEASVSHRRVVLEAPPGSGKTTRAPVALAQAVGRTIVVQPRRLAARAAASRIAFELAAEVGGSQVGYQVRFERRSTESTRLVFVTPGVLLAWLRRDPLLEGCAAVLLDEFHERGMEVDLLFALCANLQRVREDFIVGLLSATLDGAELAQRLDAAHVLSRGREYPVSVEYLARPDERAVWHRVAAGVQRVIDREEAAAGAILAFLPGVGEIRRTRELLTSTVECPVFTLYGAASLDQQMAALTGPPRRIVLATNVAESSVTVEGVRAVVDSGLQRLLRFDPGHGLDRLEVEPISKASAQQRAGRAGRQGPGTCLRLWTRAEQAIRPAHSLPEIERVDLTPLLLQCLAAGERPEALPWLDAPSPGRLQSAWDTLTLLGAVRDLRLTPLGGRLAALPLPPRLARLMIACRELGREELGAEVAALLSERDVMAHSSRESAEKSAPLDSDLEERLELLRRAAKGTKRVRQVASALRRTLHQSAETSETSESCDSSDSSDSTETFEGPGAAQPRRHLSQREVVGRSLLLAFGDRVARRVHESSLPRWRMVGGRGLVAGATRVRQAELCVALRTAGTHRGDALLHFASAVEPEWLPEEQVQARHEVTYDSERERVVGLRRTFYRDLVLSEVEAPVEDRHEAERLLVAAALVAPKIEGVFVRGDVGDFLARAACVAQWCPETRTPPFGDADRRRTIEAAAVGKRSLAELSTSPWLELVRGQWSYSQLAELDRLAPPRLELPSGRSARIVYRAGEPPILAAAIQDLFGWLHAPRLAGGRVKLLLHLLAPNGRPQQITDDLAGFWRGSYADVRRELAGRYPKHRWPKDPAALAPSGGSSDG